MFEYNNLNAVDRAVKIRGKYYRGVSSDGEFHDIQEKGVRGTTEWMGYDWFASFIYPVLVL